jgi:hypothetical protein
MSLAKIHLHQNIREMTRAYITKTKATPNL